MNADELKAILDRHYTWLHTSTNEGRADLSHADLRGADLSHADLRGADLSGADLRGADLRGADLSRADLSRADLRDANLSRADLSRADLRGAKNIPAITCAELSILPDNGDVIGWKKCRNDVIVKLLISHNTPRSNATGRKCRAESAKVLEIFPENSVAISQYDVSFTYKIGETVKVDDFDTDRWNECSSGIHFFITRIEAENY